MSIQNPEVANDLADQLDEQAAATAAEAEELDATRRDLEGRDPPRDDAPETAEADGGEIATAGADAAEAEVDETAGYTMSVDRRIGSTHLDVEYYAPGEEEATEARLAFGKPNGYSSRSLFAPIEEAEENEDQSVQEMTDYIWGTLAEWCVEDDAPGVEDAPDTPAFWGGRMGLGDAIQVLQNLALGIDPSES